MIPVIFGLQGTHLTPEEAAFFQETQPYGFILFRWNIETPSQTRSLIADLKGLLDHPNPPILVDAEGGRVFRIPFAPTPPAAQTFGDLYLQDPEAARVACTQNAQHIGEMLTDLGFTVNCAPLLDLLVPGASSAIGDRALSTDPSVVADLGSCMIKGLQDAGITPVIKHLPGQGAALEDSHETCPSIPLSHEDLKPHFLPFQKNKNAPWGMTAHVMYPTIDPTQPATFSQNVIQKTIRKTIGFKGTLITDDLYMGALSTTSPAEKVSRALAAGCDIALYARGGLEEFKQAIEGTERLCPKARFNKDMVLSSI